MTQAEVADEFIALLKKNGLLTSYGDTVEKYIAKERKPLLENSRNIEEYIHKVNDSEKIIRIDIGGHTAPCHSYYSDRTNVIGKANVIFNTYFNDKYANDIKSAIDNSKKLLIRYIKSSMTRPILDYYGSYTKAREALYNNICDDMLEVDVPFSTVIPMFGKKRNGNEIIHWCEMLKGFGKFYTNIMST